MGLCSNSNSSSSNPLWYCPSPELPQTPEEVINVPKMTVLLLVWFAEQTLRCSWHQLCHSGSSMPVWHSHYLSAFLTLCVTMTASRMSQEEAMKPQKARQRGSPCKKEAGWAQVSTVLRHERGFKGLHSLLMICSGPEPQLAYIQL